MTGTLAAILAYLVAQLALGIWVSRRIGSESDYLLAGRRLGYGLATFSLFATWFGAETVIGGAGGAYTDGWSWASPEPFGYGLCLIGMGVVFAAPLWRRRLTTLADLYRQRYSVRVERIAALVLLPGSVLWAAAQMRAFGQVVTTAAPELSIDVAMLAAAGFTILYTAFGGLLADAITDLVQGAVLIVGLCVVAIAAFLAVGGFDGVQAAMHSATQMRTAPPPVTNWLDVVEAWSIPVFGSIVAIELVGRIVGTRSEAVARRSPIIAGGMYIGIGLLPLFVGLIGGPLVGVLDDPEQLVPAVAMQLLPPVLYAVFAGGLISAILSTVDSTLLVASGLVSHNLLVPVLQVTNEQAKVRLARAGVLFLGMVAWLLARSADGVFALVEQSSAFGSAGILVTVSFALFTNVGGARAATATLLAGVLVYAGATVAGLRAPYLTSVAASLVTYLLVALSEQRTGTAAEPQPQHH